jgi:hypothetical protein
MDDGKWQMADKGRRKGGHGRTRTNTDGQGLIEKRTAAVVVESSRLLGQRWRAEGLMGETRKRQRTGAVQNLAGDDTPGQRV